MWLTDGTVVRVDRRLDPSDWDHPPPLPIVAAEGASLLLEDGTVWSRGNEGSLRDVRLR